MGKQAGHATRVAAIGRKLFSQECFLGTNDRHVDEREHRQDRDGHPEVTSGDGEANRDDDRAQVKRIAYVGVRPGHGQLSVLLHLSRGGGAKDNAQQRNESAKDQGPPCWFCAPEVKNRKHKSHRHSDAAGHTRYSIWQLADQPCFSPSNWSTASITACGWIETRPSSRRSVCVVLYTLSGLRRTTLGVPKGPLRSGRVGPNNATTGTRNAAARCMGPVSPPTKRRARRISAINFPTEHFNGTATPPLELRTASASASSPGPWLTSTAMPRSTKARATAPNDSDGQHFAPQPAPGLRIA